MEILSAIVQLLGGLALFLYGIELMGDGLKNSSGAALKRVLEKVTGNVVMGVLTGALVTAVIQSSTATIVLTVALIGAGVLNLRQAVSIVMGANIGTTVTAQILRLGSIQSDGSWLLWLFDTDTLAPIALIIGIVLLMFIKSKRSNTIGDICIGFGILFVGLNLMTSGVEPLVGTDAFIAFVRFLNNPLFGILFGLVLTVIVQSSSATVGMLQTVASVPGAGITFAMAYLTATTSLIYLVDSLYLVLTIAELALVFVLSSRVQTMSVGAARAAFFGYALLNGMVLSYYFLVFSASTLIMALLATSLYFGLMAVYGTTTHKDLTGWGPRLMMALVAMIITGFVGMLFGFGFGGSVLYCGIGLVVFMLLTAYDTQKLQQMYSYYSADAEMAEKASIYGALTLYLDFINIFLYVVRLMGNNRRRS